MSLLFVIVIVTEVDKEELQHFKAIKESIAEIGGYVFIHLSSPPDADKIAEYMNVKFHCDGGYVIIVTGDAIHKNVISSVIDRIKDKDASLTEKFRIKLLEMRYALNMIIEGFTCATQDHTLIMSLPDSPEKVVRALEVTRELLLDVMHCIADKKIYKSEYMKVSSEDNIYLGIEQEIRIEMIYYMKHPSPLVNVEDGQKIIRDKVQKDISSVGTEIVNANDAYGRISSDDIYSITNVPSFRTAAKHGFAVLASDGKGTRKILKMNNKSTPFELKSGTCVWVRSGARIPDETTAVVQITNTKLIKNKSNNISNTDNNDNNNESNNNNPDGNNGNDKHIESTNNNESNTEDNNYDNNNADNVKSANIEVNNPCIHIQCEKEMDEIEITTEPKEEENIRPIGYEIEAGDKIISKFTRIGVTEMGFLASCGYENVEVIKLPCIGVLSIGNNLIEPGKIVDLQILKTHIYDSNRITLITLLKENGFDCTDYGIVSYGIFSIMEEIKRAIEKVDILVILSHANDMLKSILTKHFKATIHFGSVNMKPGRSTTFATCKFNNKEKYFLCLSGNPISVPYAAHLFLLPIANELRCYSNVPNVLIPAHIIMRYRLHSRPKYVWTNLRWKEDKTEAEASSKVSNVLQGPFDLCNYAESNALLELPSSTPNHKIIFGIHWPVKHIE